MSNINKFGQGASILQQVDVSEIFKSLALSIAEAQEKLDQNSIEQVINLSKQQIGDKSLLELGFTPAFYAFQHADISAKINLKMAVRESMELGFGFKIDVASKKGYNERDHNFISENNYQKTNEEFKSSKTLTFKASEKKSVKIENKHFSMREDLDVKSRVEQMKEDIIRETSVEQVFEEISTSEITANNSRGIDVFIDAGYLRVEPCICNNASGAALLKINDYGSDKDIDVNGPDSQGGFELDKDIVKTLEKIYGTKGGTKSTVVLKSGADRGMAYGISKNGDFYFVEEKGTTSNFDYEIHKIPSTIYFKFNKDEINYTDNLKYKSDTNDLTFPGVYASPPDNKNHQHHPILHKVLRFIQRYDSSSRITIKGVTDPVGGRSKHNEQLAMRRAKNLKEHIFGNTAPVNVTTNKETNASGSSDLLKRKAEIKLDADYIVFVKGHTNKKATPDKASSFKNKFVFADDTSNGQFNQLNFSFAGVSINFTQTNDFNEVISHIRSALNKSKYSEKQDNHYFLHDDSVVKFHMFSSDSENIAIDENSERQSEGTEAENSFMSSEAINNRSNFNDRLRSQERDTTFAISGNLDFRMAKQFEMSMEGSAAMSARMVALPPPEAFLDYVKQNQ